MTSSNLLNTIKIYFLKITPHIYITHSHKVLTSGKWNCGMKMWIEKNCMKLISKHCILHYFFEDSKMCAKVHERRLFTALLSSIYMSPLLYKQKILSRLLKHCLFILPAYFPKNMLLSFVNMTEALKMLNSINWSKVE